MSSSAAEKGPDITTVPAHDASKLMRQKLLAADEVYLYKIPPLKGAGGHRAEDWNLGKPLQTCSLLMERRGDTLVLEFTAVNTEENPGAAASKGTLFCQSTLDCTGDYKNVSHWLEQVADSSRYFTLKIMAPGGREAVIGFGFRDRDQATDLREGMQHYERSIQRETMVENEASNLASKYTIPKLAAGEKIHVRSGKDGGNSSSKRDKSSEGKVRAPILLRKPPPSPESAAKQSLQISSSVDALDLNRQTLSEKGSRNCDVSGAQALVDEDDDDDDWETDFQSSAPPEY